jgi:nickel-dependent lactate racemase
MEPIRKSAMRVVVDFAGESLELDVSDEKVVAAWRGPAAGPEEPEEAVRNALENPPNFPPLRQFVVSGDHVVLAVDPTIGNLESLLEPIHAILRESGVEPDGVTVLSTGPASSDLNRALPSGATLAIHDPGDRGALAYLAATNHGRRIYLNRLLTDADVVIPLGRLGSDPILGYRGPWSVIFPGLSDNEAIQEHRSRFRDADDGAPATQTKASLDESFEVSWLLGTQFHIGVVAGMRGFTEIVAGRELDVRSSGIDAWENHWTFDAGSRAELVVVGVGRPGIESDFFSVADALATATRLVQHGGRIVLLSRLAGELGPSLRRLTQAEDPKRAKAVLGGHEGDPDYLAARQFAHALGWADVFLLSNLPRETVEELSAIPLENPEQARRLVTRAGSCSFASAADLTRVRIHES